MGGSRRALPMLHQPPQQRLAGATPPRRSPGGGPTAGCCDRSSVADMASQSIGKLFDDITRTESGAPATYRERLSTFNFLNHAGGEQWTQARELLESWYSDYPDESKDRLRNDFRSEMRGNTSARGGSYTRSRSTGAWVTA
jgi:hypothetical protein